MFLVKDLVKLLRKEVTIIIDLGLIVIIVVIVLLIVKKNMGI